jgi:hypothetical protein
MKLKNLRPLGRFNNESLNKTVNIYSGTRVGYGTDITFYYKFGKRIVIDDREYYDNWVRIGART